MSMIRSEEVRQWKPILRALDPLREVGLEEIDDLYAERRAAPYKEIATDLLTADRAAEVKVILCGARGSGKSTELTRLARELSPEFCVVHTDLAAGLPEQAGTLAVLTLLGVAGLHAIQIWSSDDDTTKASVALVRGSEQLQGALTKFGAAGSMVTTLLDAVSGIVTVFNPAAGAVLATTNAVAKATGSLVGKATELRHALGRGPLQGRLPADKRDDTKAVVDAVNSILDELERLAGKPVVLLADGLDKRTGVEEVQLALSEEYLLRELRAPLVLTGPVNLRHDPRFRAMPGGFRLALLYNIPVCERGGEAVRPASEGIALLRELYERRRSASGIRADLMSAGILDRAALMCSGIIREFLGLLHATCKNALQSERETATPEDLEAAIRARRLAMEGYLNEQSVGILRRVLAKGIVPAGEAADVLLFENFIACYPNGDVWFRPHELIADYIANQSVAE